MQHQLASEAFRSGFWYVRKKFFIQYFFFLHISVYAATLELEIRKFLQSQSLGKKERGKIPDKAHISTYAYVVLVYEPRSTLC